MLIHQELPLSPEPSVAENINLMVWPTNRFGVLKKLRLRRDATATMSALGADFGPGVRLGMALAPDRRKEQGLVLGQGGRTNISLLQPELLSKARIINVAEELRVFASNQDRLEIKTTGPEQSLSDLSGGSQ